MNWPVFIFEWLHVLLAIAWFGWVLSANLVLFPALLRLPVERQLEVIRGIEQQATRVVRPVAIGTILSGALRGTVFGPITSWQALTGTRYGVTWLVALVGGIGVFVLAELVLVPAARHLGQLQLALAGAGPGAQRALSEGVAAQTRRVKLLLVAELLGFLGIFTAMIVLHFS